MFNLVYKKNIEETHDDTLGRGFTLTFAYEGGTKEVAYNFLSMVARTSSPYLNGS